MDTQNGYPAGHGYYFPAEWEKHRATWLTYPYNTESWSNRELEKARTEYLEFMRIISLGEKLKIIVQDEATRQQLMDEADKKGVYIVHVQIYVKPSNDCWSRDHAPVFLKHSKHNKLAAVGFEFNGWGGKYEHALDNQLKWHIIEQEGCEFFQSTMILEGGSIETNGSGLVLTTASCLLNANRNPHLQKPEIENRLKKYLGVQTVLWLSDGIEGDDTDGHIDDITRFVAPQKVVTAMEENKSDINHKPLLENYHLLEKMAKKGYLDDIKVIPMPTGIYSQKNRLPASYANFYICNAGVIVPVFKCRQDEKALQQIQDCFPGKTVYPVDARTIIKGLGSWHCLSQQVPGFDHKCRVI